jgi:hypothetical protein
MPFALDSSPSTSEISEAINYLLGNFGANISADPNTGQIIGPTGQVSGYLYKYMAVKYADSFDGSVNFSNTPTNRLYFGLRNNNDPAESNNHADYIWYEAAGGFGVTKSLWYVSTGGRQIQFEVSVSAPDTGWLVDPGSSIDLDVVTSGNIPVIAEAFVPYFTPNTLQVPRAGTPLAPVFTNIVPVMYATDAGAVVPFSDAQTDTGVSFLNGTWRIGNSATTGNADISYTNITIGNPTDAGDYAQWPSPTAMSASPAYITVPVRYKNGIGIVSQAGVATVQLVFTDPGSVGPAGPTLEINGYTAFVQNAGGAFTPTTATLTAVPTNVTAPTYSWTIAGATPTSASTASVVITPTSSSTGVDVSLTVNGSNLLAPITRTLEMPVVYDGAPGQAGANGLMSAFPSIYIWTGAAVPPTRPSTTSTYTWSNGSYAAPSGWSTEAPTNTTPGNYLWIITVPLTVSATTTTSTLDWTNVTYPIRAIAYNGENGADGTNGLNGTRTAILDVYQWSVSAPTTFPSGSSTYTWATGQFTAPAVLNGWSLTPPASVLGQTLWVARTLYADTLVSATSIVTWNATTSVPAGASGTDGNTGPTGNDGQNGSRTAFLEVYQWAASTPTVFPSGTSTYTWANGSFTAPTTPNGWSLTPGASTPGFNLYGCSVRYADLLTTATTSVTWSTGTAYIVGAAGTNGTNGLPGAAGTAGASTFVITRAANDSSPPTNGEVSALLGRNPVSGYICTISYNLANNAVVYRFVTTWALFQTYITGSLIVQNTITGDKIVANTITADKITSGTTSTLNGGTFSLGASGTVLNGFSGVGAFESNTNGKWGLMTFLENASATQGAALGACVFGNGAPALGAFSATSTAYNSFYTAFASATNSVAGNGRYNRSIGTPNNMDLIPFNTSVLNNNDNAGYFAYFGGSASSRITEAFIANTTTLSAGVFRRYNTAGTTLVNETYLNNANYSVESTLGAIYSAGGYLPFTGVHDGLIQETENLVVGDIVVDYQVEAVLNPSNVVMLYKKSSAANQAGAIGVCIQIFDVPPTDWEEYQQTGEVDPITGAPVQNPDPVPNPMYYPIPAGQKVIHVNALGEGTINVCGEGGNIEIGDLIVTSSTPGKGMKQSDDFVRSITVAKSRQAVTFSSSADIQQIACIYLGG